MVVLGELLVAVLLVGLAGWGWQRGVVITVDQGVEVSRIVAGWWAGTTAAVTLAGLLVLHAVHHVVRERGVRRNAAVPENTGGALGRRRSAGGDWAA